MEHKLAIANDIEQYRGHKLRGGGRDLKMYVEWHEKHKATCELRCIFNLHRNRGLFFLNAQCAAVSSP